jgi:prepilin-type N-terminal cleavage/methylation domain-containing protein
MRPRSRCAGYTLIELMVVVAVIATLACVALAQARASIDHSRGHAAARYLASRLSLARTQAVARGVAIGLRFEQVPGGFAFGVFRDGNGNGIRTADIQSGIDVPIEPPTSLFEQFPGVDIGLTPASPGTDPVQLGQTDLLTFTPTGTATAGTIYIHDREDTQWAVRVLGATGRTRVLRYDPRTKGWLVAD